MTLEQKEIFRELRLLFDKYKNDGVVIPDVVYQIIDEVEKTYANSL
jgi:hypothetical protein